MRKSADRVTARTAEGNRRWCQVARFTIVATMAAFLSTGSAIAQQKKITKEPLRPGVVSGRVFLITVAGDLKPARIAEVYLLYDSNPPEDYKSGSAGNEWPLQVGRLQTSEKMREAISKPFRHFDIAGDPLPLSDSDECRLELAFYSLAIRTTVREYENKAGQVQSTDADEEGNFKILVRRPGRYTILAYGHAGFNEAFWESDLVAVQPGEETIVKLSSPKKACLNMNN